MTDRELIQALRDEDITDVRDMMDYMETAADRLEALLAENERLKAQLPNWVSVEERLPETEKIDDPEDEWWDSRLVLAATRDAKVCLATYWVINKSNGWTDEVEQAPVTVTHWMPLPEPPSTEGVE